MDARLVFRESASTRERSHFRSRRLPGSGFIAAAVHGQEDEPAEKHRGEDEHDNRPEVHCYNRQHDLHPHYDDGEIGAELPEASTLSKRMDKFMWRPSSRPVQFTIYD